MTVKKGGLLSRSSIKKARELRKKHMSLLRFVHKVNKLTERSKFKIVAHKNNPQEIISACLLMRILDGSQAAILLVERGFDLDAPLTIRGVFEALVYLKLCCEDKKFAQEYILLHEATKLKIIYQALEDPLEELYAELLRSEKDERTINDVISEIKINLSTQGISAENPKELKKFLRRFEKRTLAERAGYLNHYRTFYYETSNYVHINPKVLTRYFEINEKGAISRFCHGPSDEHAKLYLITIADLELASLVLISKFFNLHIDKEIGVLQNELRLF